MHPDYGQVIEAAHRASEFHFRKRSSYDMLRSILYDLAQAETSAETQRHYSVLVRSL